MDQNQLALLIPILTTLGLFALIFGIIYLKNKEKMAMIERGMDPRTALPKQRQNNPSFILTLALLLIGSGLGLLIAWIIDHLLFYRTVPSIYFALIAIFGGLGLFTSYWIEAKSNKKNKEL